MIFTIFSIFYVLIAVAMIVLILMQRGDGANAGASFGGGSSGTVFGARGTASFLTRATGVLAGLFFLLSLSMAIYLSHHGMNRSAAQTLGVMAGSANGVPAAGASAGSAVPPGSPAAAATSAAPTAIPLAPAASSAAANPEIPVAPAPAGSAPPASH